MLQSTTTAVVKVKGLWLNFAGARSFSALDMLVLFFSSHGDDQSGRVKRAHVKKVILCGSLCDKFHTNTDFAEEQRSGRLEFKASPVEQLFRNRTVRFKDGSSASVDIILCCTGYEAHYPMLDKVRSGGGWGGGGVGVRA